MKKDKYCRTDLAVEWQQEEEGRLPAGVAYEEKRELGFAVHRLSIRDEQGAAAMGRQVGCYLTLEIGRPWMLSDERLADAKTLLAKKISVLAFGEGAQQGEISQKEISQGKTAPKEGPQKGGQGQEEEREEGDGKEVSPNQAPGAEGPVLVVGLGNRKMTADAIGPMTVDRITVTRHVEQLDPALFSALSHRSVAAVCPGVLGQTGLESAATVKALAKTVHPRLILAVDALAAKSSSRLAATVQLSTGGIAPGSGVGNDRPAFTKESLGVPVLAIGVPMVVDSSTLVADALEEAGLEEIPEALLPVLENGRSFFVSLKEADAATEAMADLLASAIDQAMSV